MEVLGPSVPSGVPEVAESFCGTAGAAGSGTIAGEGIPAVTPDEEEDKEDEDEEEEETTLELFKMDS